MKALLPRGSSPEGKNDPFDTLFAARDATNYPKVTNTARVHYVCKVRGGSCPPGPLHTYEGRPLALAVILCPLKVVIILTVPTCSFFMGSM